MRTEDSKGEHHRIIQLVDNIAAEVSKAREESSPLTNDHYNAQTAQHDQLTAVKLMYVVQSVVLFCLENTPQALSSYKTLTNNAGATSLMRTSTVESHLPLVCLPGSNCSTLCLLHAETSTGSIWATGTLLACSRTLLKQWYLPPLQPAELMIPSTVTYAHSFAGKCM